MMVGCPLCNFRDSLGKVNGLGRREGTRRRGQGGTPRATAAAIPGRIFWPLTAVLNSGRHPHPQGPFPTGSPRKPRVCPPTHTPGSPSALTLPSLLATYPSTEVAIQEGGWERCFKNESCHRNSSVSPAHMLTVLQSWEGRATRGEQYLGLCY